MSTALIAYGPTPSCATADMAVSIASFLVGLVGFIGTTVVGMKNKRIAELEKQLEAAQKHNEVADLQRELQLLRDENEMLVDKLVEEQLKNSVAALSDTDSARSNEVVETHAPLDATSIQEAVLNGLRVGRNSAGALRELLKEAFPGVKKSDVNSALYKLRAKHKVGIVEQRGAKPIWAIVQ